MEQLNKLTKQQLIRLEEFICSPYHNKSRSVKKMFYYLKEFHPNIEKKHFEQDSLVRNVFEGKTITPVNFRKQLSLFNLVLDQFYICEAISEDKMLQQTILLRKLSSAECFERTVYSMGKIRQMEKDKQITNHFRYYLKFIALEIMININSERTTKEALKYFNEYLESFERMIEIHEMDISEYYTNCKFKFPRGQINYTKDIQNVYSRICKNKSYYKKKHPYIYLSYLRKKAIDNSDFKIYQQACDFYKIFEKSFTQELHSDFQMMKFNFLMNGYQRYDENSRYYVEELFNFMDKAFMCENPDPCMFCNGTILITFFIISVRVSSQLKKFQWAESFIEKYKDKLHPDSATDVYHFSLSILNLFKRQFNQALENLNKISFRLHDISVLVKKNQLVIYFELGEEQGVLNTLEKLDELLKDGNLNRDENVLTLVFLNNMKKLCYLKFGNPLNKEYDINKFLEYLNDPNTTNVVSKGWFREKLTEMRKEINSPSYHL